MGWLKSSILSYPDRGPWGRWDYRGNCSGHLIVDLIKQYRPSRVLDPMSGSYTTRDVCKELGIECDAYDLHDGFDALTDVLPPKKYDLVFLHPPYHSMIRYSEDSRDLSNCSSVPEFNQKLSNVVTRFSEYLSDEGRMVILIGNMRKNGRYYPLGAYLETLFHEELKEEIIKVQHNVTSSSKEYANYNFVPIMHEKVLVFAGFRPVTWDEIVLRAMDELGGMASTKELYKKLERHPKTLTNQTFRATIRRTLQENAEQVDLGMWSKD